MRKNNIRNFHIFLADAIFALHCIIGIFILTGWYFPQIKIAYIIFLLCWLFCWFILGYCPVTYWEFALRRKYNPALDPKEEALQHYMNKFFNINLSSRGILKIGLVVFVILITLTVLRSKI